MLPAVNLIGTPCSSSSFLNLPMYCNLLPWLSYVYAESNDILKMSLSVLSSHCSGESSALDLPPADSGLSRFEVLMLGLTAGAMLILGFVCRAPSFENGFSGVLPLSGAVGMCAFALRASSPIRGPFGVAGLWGCCTGASSLLPFPALALADAWPPNFASRLLRISRQLALWSLVRCLGHSPCRHPIESRPFLGYGPGTQTDTTK